MFYKNLCRIKSSGNIDKDQFYRSPSLVKIVTVINTIIKNAFKINSKIKYTECCLDLKGNSKLFCYCFKRK